jgi:two-component system, NtrC family, sensor kinase
MNRVNSRGKLILTGFPVLFLIVLGGINIFKNITWKEPTDGVTWGDKPTGLTALKVEVDSPGYLASIKKGDILYSINNIPIKTRIDLVTALWIARGTDQKASYQIGREGEIINPSFFLEMKGVNLIYYYLALVGLTTLVIGIIVFLNSRRRFSMPYFYFYLLSLAFYSFSVFSPTGNLDILDTVFYGLDKIAFLMFPPLLLHFFLIFPQRKKILKKLRSATALIYLPGFLLLLARILFHTTLAPGWSDAEALGFQALLERLDLLHFSLYSLAALATVIDAMRHPASIFVRKQLKLIVAGLSFGIVPFALFYTVPFLAGRAPSTPAELTVLLQALIPLTFAYSISRYKLMDFEVLLKKAVTLIIAFFAIALVYYVVSSQTRIFSENRLNAIILGVLAIILGATVFTPLKKLVQTLLDRVIYRRSYEYRKMLLFISREISRERNLQNLSRSLLESIANALSLRTIALYLADDTSRLSFQLLRSWGDSSSVPPILGFDETFYEQMQANDYLSYYSQPDRKGVQKIIERFIPFGFHHFLPLKVEGKIIGCLAMGRKQDGTYLTGDDWELLTTVSPSVGLALENAYLYSRESVRALEMQRLKDYSENIIESLTVGVAVIDQAGAIIGWNRVLESQFILKKAAVMGRKLSDILGAKNFAALFPPDTQADFRPLTEIGLEIPGGPKRIFDIARTPLLDNHMNPYGTIIVFEDITEKIGLQQQLLTSEKLASIGLLSAGVAHEINTPLTGISSYVQMLQKKLTDTHYAQILEKIEAQTDRVGRIIKNLLNFARNPADASFQRVDLKETLEEIISLIEYKLKTMHIELVLDLVKIPPIYAQGERLQQVFINIILNALDAMPDGGRLTLGLSQEGLEAAVKITDTGVGIKPEHLARIFDPFFTTKGVGKGTGLGLSISYAIIKEHEGWIHVASEAGKGTTFTVFVPTDLGTRPSDKSPVSRKSP